MNFNGPLPHIKEMPVLVNLWKNPTQYIGSIGPPPECIVWRIPREMR